MKNKRAISRKAGCRKRTAGSLHPAGSAHAGISPELKAKYDALPKSEQEKLTGRWLVENLPQVTDPALVEVLEEISAPNGQAHPTAADRDGGAGGKESNGK